MRTVLDQLTAGDAQTVADTLKAYGRKLQPVKATFTGLTAAVAFTMSALTPASSIGLREDEAPPPIGTIRSLRVTAAAAGYTGQYIQVDSGATPAAPGTGAGVPVIGTAKVSEDGDTLTFPTSSAVTAFVIEYDPLPEYDMANTAWPR